MISRTYALVAPRTARSSRASTSARRRTASCSSRRGCRPRAGRHRRPRRWTAPRTASSGTTPARHAPSFTPTAAATRATPSTSGAARRGRTCRARRRRPGRRGPHRRGGSRRPSPRCCGRSTPTRERASAPVSTGFRCSIATRPAAPERIALHGTQERHRPRRSAARGARRRPSAIARSRARGSTSGAERTLFVFEGRGFGHGVGLCQAGALARVRAGAKPAAILQHYFPGTRLMTLG